MSRLFVGIAKFSLALLLLLPLSDTTWASQTSLETVKITLSGQNALVIQRVGHAKQRLLWLSTQKTQATDLNLAQQFADAGLEVWVATIDTKTAQHTLSTASIAELIEESLPKQSTDKLYLFSTGENTALSLSALTTWQEVRGQHSQLGGLILIDPQLNSPEAPKALKLPIYLFHAAQNFSAAQTEKFIDQLEQSGNVVYTELIPDVAADFLHRDDLTEEEALQVGIFPALLIQALAKLDATQLASTDSKAVTEAVRTLTEHPTQALAPALKLTALDGKLYDLTNYRGKTVLVNFWATWCPACVEEIPSLNNLQKKFSTDDFVILSVVLGEEQADIKRFLERIPADYPVLLDSDNTLMEPWQLRAFPSTFLIDKTGHLRYTYFGGLQWDSTEITNFLEKNLQIVAK